MLFTPLLCTWITWLMINSLFIPSYTHIDTVQFEEYTYHLGYSYGAERGGDYTLYDLIIFECQYAGLVCLHVGPSYDVGSDFNHVMRRSTGFEIKDEQLYIKMGEERLDVGLNYMGYGWRLR